jgi:hypothetical protein
VAAKGAGSLSGDELLQLFVNLPEVVAGPLQKGVEKRLLELYGDVPHLLSREDGEGLLHEVCKLPPVGLAELASSDGLRVASENDVLVGCSGVLLVAACLGRHEHWTKRTSCLAPHPLPTILHG